MATDHGRVSKVTSRSPFADRHCRRRVSGARFAQIQRGDAAAPDWRKQGASYAAGEESGAGTTPDPYEVLGVPRDAPMEDVVKAHRRIMQRVHPDLANVGDWFARVVTASYRTIRQERGETA